MPTFLMHVSGHQTAPVCRLVPIRVPTAYCGNIAVEQANKKQKKRSRIGVQARKRAGISSTPQQPAVGYMLMMHY